METTQDLTTPPQRFKTITERSMEPADKGCETLSIDEHSLLRYTQTTLDQLSEKIKNDSRTMADM